MAVRRMNRRDLLKTGVTAAAVSSVALPQEHVHLLAPQAIAKAGTAWKPTTLSAAQNELVVTLSELIIPTTDTPGAKAANVNRYIDLFLGEMPASERDRFLNGLTWLNEYSTKQHAADFIKLDPVKQVAILETLDAGGDAAVEDGHQFFRMVKSMTARVYYQTQIGFKELNKGGVPGTFGCKHDSHNQ